MSEILMEAYLAMKTPWYSSGVSGYSTNTHPHTNNMIKSIKIGKLTDQYQYDTANTNIPIAAPAPSLFNRREWESNKLFI